MNTPTSRLTTLSLCAFMALPACADPQAGGPGQDQEDTGQEDTGQEDTGQEDDMSREWVLARGVSITSIEANQGLGVALLDDSGAPLEPAEHEGVLVAGRETLVRVGVELDPDWAAHQVEARLILSDAEGVETLLSEVLILDGVPDLAVTGREEFWFWLDDELTRPELGFVVELIEHRDSSNEALELGRARSSETPVQLGFDPQPTPFEIVFVPITYVPAGTTYTFPKLERMTERLEQVLPVSSFVWSLHEPVVVNTQPQMKLINDQIELLRESEGADPHVFYHAMVDPGLHSGAFDYLFWSDKAEPTLAAGVDRTSTLMSLDPVWDIDYLVQTVMFTTGIDAMPCWPYEEVPVDYIDPEGKIGAWGFGVLDHQLRAPDSFYPARSRCFPHWVGVPEWAEAHAYLSTLAAATP